MNKSTLSQRQRRIIEISQTQSTLSVPDIANLFSVSEMTIRRDLRQLDHAGLLRRIHGGAIADRGRSYEPAYMTRAGEQTKQKEAIGRYAAGLVAEGDSIVLDVGTTTLEIARCLAGMQNLTILTSSLRIANVLADSPGVRLIVTGGVLRSGEQSLVGHLAERALQDFHVDKALIGVGGIDPQNGLTEFNLEDSLVKRVIVEHAKKVIVATDSSKLGRTCLNSVAPLARVDVVVTDEAASPAIVNSIRQKGIDVIVVPV
ncbi:MAG: DeoR/GlpR family DNA-binding transcription regulator [Chloroflexi bacterium]|nr:DeoR/GlpR family DNA-binding transcription regulator [Chloroflexota bacterium]